MSTRAATVAIDHASRTCDSCGQMYFRRNKIEAWVQRRQGDVFVWVKIERYMCVHCLPSPKAQRILNIVATARPHRA